MEPPSVDEQRAAALEASPPNRERWIPAGSRDPAHAALNDAELTDSYFVYLPKITQEISWDVSGGDPITGTLYTMELPVGANCYKGIRTAAVNCVNVNRPEAADCRHCETYAWYSDYITALLYSTLDKPRMQTYCFKATAPLRLINLMDNRNLELIVRWLEAMIRGSEQRVLPNPYIAGMPTEEQLDEHMRSSYGDQLIAIATATGYELSPATEQLLRDRDFRGYYPRDAARDRPAALPAGVAELESEFGDQYVLDRFSRNYTDLPMIRALKALNEKLGLGLHGYYAPTYKKFNREIALFKSKGLLRHDQTDPRNGCVMQAGQLGGRRTRRAKRSHRRRLTRVA
jgi:hypothetical protein